ncbi:MAG: A/G-specific adenine glycosylase [Planctomycetes bacterium]|nr:A/G-specific adenine glycosylase [Planctomycetota bacterium]
MTAGVVASLTDFRRALVAWYRRHARPLPWRATRDPYQIWISEIMLQQTTVTAVVPYFQRFLARFPTLQDLAAAQEQSVLRLWEGLGYYSRARNIHKAARLLVNEHRGEFPREPGELMALPGIGRYTAGAIASFAFDWPAPIVEANTLRLYARLMGLRDDPRSARGQKQLWEFAEQIVPARHAGEFNQALMELGARVCVPSAPDCSKCPVRRWCVAATNGWQAEIPLPKPRAAPTEITEVAVAVHRDGKYLLRKRPEGVRWAGLWDFVRFGWRDAETRSPALHDVAVEVRRETGLTVEITAPLAEIRHSVTRFRITLQCHLGEWLAGEHDHAQGESRWVASTQFARLPLSVTGRKLARMIAARESKSTSASKRPG